MSSLYEYLCRFYTPSEFPALAQQALLWQQSLPLKGKVIYDATPVFRNTMVKYWALQCAGAQVVAGVGDNIPYDPAVCALLPEFGITVAGGGEKLKEYDVVADCAGSSRHIAAKYGYVELTRSGLEYYRQWQKPVFSADSGVLKKLATPHPTLPPPKIKTFLLWKSSFPSCFIARKKPSPVPRMVSSFFNTPESAEKTGFCHCRYYSSPLRVNST